VHDFVYALFTVPSQSLPEALDKLQHGASQIMGDCPALTDPDRGGRMNMKHFRVRMLTSEMIEQLVRAYREWPFKEPGSDHNKYFRWKGMNKGMDYGNA
jgi:transcription factor 1